MRRMTASEFKARCLKVMDEVAETGEEVVITKRGQPVSRLVPHQRRPDSLFGLHRGKIRMHDDLVEPALSEWEATE